MRHVLPIIAALAACSAPSAGHDASIAADAPRPDTWTPIDDGGADAAELPDAFASDAWTCTLVPQAGCGSAACRLIGNSTSCTPITSQPGEYMPCSADDDCGAGQQCISLGSAAGCRVWCTSSTACDQSRGARHCIFPSALYNADTSIELHPPAGVGICGA